MAMAILVRRIDGKEGYHILKSPRHCAVLGGFLNLFDSCVLFQLKTLLITNTTGALFSRFVLINNNADGEDVQCLY